MLSRVLSGAGAARAVPLARTQAGVATPVAAIIAFPQAAVSDTVAESRVAQDRIRELETVIANTKREAFEAGRNQGQQEARAEMHPVMERAAASIAEITAMRPQLRQSAEKDAVQLALMIAKRVLHRELQVDEHALTALAKVVFGRLGHSETWQLTMHPKFIPAIEASLSSRQAARITIEADPACAPGTFLLRSTEGQMDASVETQLEEISRGLTDRIS